jgi:hypothetical protein
MPLLFAQCLRNQREAQTSRYSKFIKRQKLCSTMLAEPSILNKKLY